MFQENTKNFSKKKLNFHIGEVEGTSSCGFHSSGNLITNKKVVSTNVFTAESSETEKLLFSVM